MPVEDTLIADFSGGSFTSVEGMPNPVQGTVMPVVAIKGEDIRMLGTCFAISNHGLILTARHVVDEALGLFNGRGTPDNEVHICVIYTSTETHDDDPNKLIGGIIPIATTNLNPCFDIALLHANLPINTVTGEQLKIPALKLSPAIPPVNFECFALGYHDMDCMQNTTLENTFNISQKLSASKGSIQVVHFPNRDRNVLSFPCFEVNSRYDAGMSGGPVTDSTGAVIGVICSSLVMHDSTEHTSYASLIGPALLLQIDGLNAEGKKERMFLHDFVIGGSVLTDQTIEAISVTRDENTLLVDFAENRRIRSTLNT